MSDVSQQMLHNQVMQEAPSPQKNAYFTTLRTTAMAAAELRNQSMDLERDKIQLERLKVQKELRLMKDSDMNNEVEIADDDSNSGGVNDLNKDSDGVNDLNKCTWPMCVMQQAPELCNVCKMQAMHHVCQTETE